LISNRKHPQFCLVSDRNKINNLLKLNDLSINNNPIVSIPLFNNSNLKTFSIQNTLIASAQFPSSYSNCHLQTLSLKNNRIRTINNDDFSTLANNSLSKLNLDSTSISTISTNAFQSLTKLQSLSLKNNLLQTCQFLLNLPVLSSIHLDGNQFKTLPEELSMPGKIKTYSFRNNSISIIDESSPLNKWLKTNRTDTQIYLANNSFDCCASIWFVRFLKTSRQFVGDADQLICASPIVYAGKSLLSLKPDEMNCDGHHSGGSIGLIVGLIFGVVLTIGIIIVLVVLFKRFRNHPSRQGYQEIGGNDPESLYRNMDPTIARGPAFPTDDDDDPGYDTIPSSVYGHHTNSGPPSEAPTRHTAEGHDAVDVEPIAIEEETPLPI